MNGDFLGVVALMSIVLGAGCWLGWQLLRQNGRMLLRLDEIEKRLDALEFSEADPQPYGEAPKDERASRFRKHSLARSRIKRDGLKAGTPAPDFRLPRLDGGELSIYELRGKRVLLVFSDPHCGPCNALAPHLEKFHRATLRKNTLSAERGSVTRSTSEIPEPLRVTDPRSESIALVMISRGEPKENRKKVKEHGLTFPVVLQQHWEISRLYAMFATPVAYLIGEDGVIADDVAVGVEPILSLMDLAAADGIPCSTPEVRRDEVMTETKV
jgi:peroxiredoxin